MPHTASEQKLVKRTIGVLSCILLMSIFAVWAVYAQHQNVENTRLMLQRSYQIQVELQQLFSLVQDAETGHRGYLLTGDPAFLVPYVLATPAVSSSVKRLKIMMNGDPVLARQIDQLERTIMDKQSEMARTIAFRETLGHDAAVLAIQGGAGRAMMDAIRLGIAQLRDAEVHGRAEQRVSEQRELHLLVGLFLVLIAAIATVLATAGVIAFNALRQRIASEAALRQQKREAQGLQRIAEAVSLAPTLRHALASVMAELMQLLNGERGFAVWRERDDQPGEAKQLSLARQPDGTLAPSDSAVVSEADLQGWPQGYRDQGVRIVELAESGRPLGLSRIYVPVSDLMGPRALLTITVQQHHPSAETIDTFAVAAATQLAHAAEEQRILDSLNDSLARHEGIFEGAIDGVLILRTDGSIESVNPAGLRMFGYTVADAPHLHVSKLLPDARLIVDEVATASREHPRIGAINQSVGQRKDGSRFDVDIALTELALYNDRLLVAVIRDTTERRRLEQIKNEFIATVSHELRTPLTSINGALRLLQAGSAGQLPPKAARLTEIAQINSERLARLVNDILDIERIESGLVHFDISPQPVHAIVKICIDANVAFAQRYGVMLEFRPCTEDLIVLADADRLNQVLTNLLANAVKFSPSGSVVTVAVQEYQGMARLKVIDQGPGIPSEFHPRIFQKFAQADASDHRSKGGTGLGLSITRQLITQMKGHLSFTTGPNGTTFTVDIPLARTAGVDSSSPALALNTEN